MERFASVPSKHDLPFVGRSDVRNVVFEAFEQALKPESNAVRMCFIEGPQGVGKDRLLRDLEREGTDRGIAVARAGTSARSLGALIPLIRASYRSHDPDDRWISSRKEAIETLIGAGGDEAAMPAVTPLDGAFVASLLAGVNQPTLYIITDAQDLDPQSLDVLTHLSRLLTPLSALGDASLPPCFFALTFVDDGSAGSANVAAMSESMLTVNLGGLGVEEVGRLVSDLLGQQPLESTHLADLHRLTDGIPGRVHEALFALQESGDLRAEEDRWIYSPQQEARLPDDDSEIIRRRIAALSEEALEDVRKVAIHPGPVREALVKGLCGEEAIEPLVERGILERTRADGVSCLTFAHLPFKDEVSRGITPELRRALHRETAEWLEQFETGDDMVELLAQHWSAGGAPERAITFLIAAAERSRAVGDLVSEIEWYRKGYELLPQLGLSEVQSQTLEARVLLPLGGAERSHGDYTSAEDRFERVLALGEALNEGALICSALDRMALVMIDTGRLERALSLATRYLERARRDEDSTAQAMALRLRGVIRREMSGPAAGIRDLEDALHVAGTSPEMADARARIAIALSYAYTEAGDYAAGLSWAQWGLDLSRDEGIVELEPSFLINISMAQFLRGRPDLTLRSASEAMEICDARGMRRNYVLALGNAGDALRALGQFQEAEQYLRAALRDTYKTKGGALVVSRLLELADLMFDQKRSSDGLVYLKEAWRVLPQHKSPRVAASVAICELRLRLWLEDAREQRACQLTDDELIQSVEAGLFVSSDYHEQMQLEVFRGALALQRGDAEEAADSATRAHNLLEGGGQDGLIGRPDVAVAYLSLVRGCGQDELAERLHERWARAVKAKAASIEDSRLRQSYLAAPLISQLMDFS